MKVLRTNESPCHTIVRIERTDGINRSVLTNHPNNIIYASVIPRVEKFERCHNCFLRNSNDPNLNCKTCRQYTFLPLPEKYNILDLEDMFQRNMDLISEWTYPELLEARYQDDHRMLFQLFLMEMLRLNDVDLKGLLSRSLKRGMNVRSFNDMALRTAIFSLRPEMVKILINNFKCKVDVEVLLYAVAFGRFGSLSVEILKELLSHFDESSKEIEMAVQAALKFDMPMTYKYIKDYFNNFRKPEDIEMAGLILG